MQNLESLLLNLDIQKAIAKAQLNAKAMAGLPAQAYLPARSLLLGSLLPQQSEIKRSKEEEDIERATLLSLQEGKAPAGQAAAKEAPSKEVWLARLRRKIPGNPDQFEFDVPADGSCLFYSVALAHLLPVTKEKALFEKNFVQLFGPETLPLAESYRQALLKYQGEADFMTKTLNFEVLVNKNFRSRVIDTMVDNLELFNDEAQLGMSFEKYIARMQDPNLKLYGGHPEILAMSLLLQSKIVVYRQRIQKPDEVENGGIFGAHFPKSIYLIHTLYKPKNPLVDVVPVHVENNHYHFLVETRFIPELANPVAANRRP